MNDSNIKNNWKMISILVALIPVGFLAWSFQDQWLPTIQGWAQPNSASESHIEKSEEGDAHAGEDPHDHGHEGHNESDSLELSAQARKNIGLTSEKLIPIKLQSFTRTISIPAMVVERPGNTRVTIVAPMTGIVTNVNVNPGEAVQSGRELFKIRLTHEDLVQAQAAYLKTRGELDVENKEIARIQEITSRGVIAGKVLLEREYAKEILEAVLKSQREALLLHGFSKSQVDQIDKTKHLIREHQIYVPKLNDQSGEVQLPNMSIRRVSANTPTKKVFTSKSPKSLFIVQSLNVSKGDFVEAGDTLCVLADYSDLYLKGEAFEQEADEVTRCMVKKWSVQAIREVNNKAKKLINNLKIDYLDNQIETDVRTFSVFVNLPNRILYDTTRKNGDRFITWQFKPGQRMQLRIPVEIWEKQIVVPIEAVASEGAEKYVFQENGDHFDRRPVHILYQDQLWAVIENDGSIFPGDKIALTGAHQLQMALKNKAGGGVDPHAGHTH
ncbi:MAG: efflux RND transporter periplasmic adaptor subunit [Gimesia sp.]